MTCENCKRFDECKEKAEKDENKEARMHNLSFWGVSEICEKFLRKEVV
jgi:hypothetical protein